MTYSALAKYVCLIALAMTVSMSGWSTTRFFPDRQPLGSIAPIVLSNADLSRNKTKAYRPWFENGSWQGDLVEYTVTPTGALSSSINLSGTSPLNTGSKSNWSALLNFASAAETNPDYWFAKRRIITWDGSKQVSFLSDRLGAANMARIDPNGGTAAHSSKILNFVRGDRSQEYPAGALRHRTSILGDIIHSTPVFVGIPNETHQEKGYPWWAATWFDRAGTIYAGANDGMLHVFEAATGTELYAYVPSMLFEKLRQLTARPYTHTYFVDGELTIRDAYFKNDWHTVLVGTLGAGGKGFFGLDVTNPGIQGPDAVINKVLFEFDARADNDLGDSFSKALIAKLNDGKWYVVIGNGYNSVNGVAMLYLVNLETLALTKISTGSGAAGSPNGLSSPGLVDYNRDGKADYAYAGDIDGNLWKFDLSDKDPTNWKEAYDRPLHAAVDKQPITVAPQMTRHPYYGFMVYFGTGRLYTSGDLTDESVQAMYGIWDSGDTPPDKNSENLLVQTWEGPKTYKDPQHIFPGTQTIAIYNEDAGDVNWTGTEAGIEAKQHGWKVEFPPGYRVLQPVYVRSNRVKATVHHPRAGKNGKLGANWLVEAAIGDGGPNPKPIFDLNVDEVLNEADKYENSDDAPHVPMMWRQPDGIMSQVTIAVIGSGVDTMFINYLQPPFTEPCSGDCANGFQRGHIDVTTWLASVPPGGGYTQNTDEYDKDVGRVYVDFFDLNVSAAQGEQTARRKDVTGQVEIDSTGDPEPSSTIGETEEFIVVLANADLSPAATLKIGDQEWNALEYQRQIHIALMDWKPAAPDAVAPSQFIHTWGAITAAGGTISLNFNDDAIQAGGIHPTQPECVKDSAFYKLFTDEVASGAKTLTLPERGRWRNGALTVQLIRKSLFTNNPGSPNDPAIAKLYVQHPSDLAPQVTLGDGTTIATFIDYDNDGNTQGEYEQIGGLIAPLTSAGTDAHIWESTLFWHFGALYSLATGNAPPCYGDDPNWQAAVALELSADPVAAALKALGQADFTLEAAIAQSRVCGPNGDGTCIDLYDQLQALSELAPDYSSASADDGMQNNGETPVIMNGGAEGAGNIDEGSITEGQTFERGRVSWTDLVN